MRFPAAAIPVDLSAIQKHLPNTETMAVTVKVGTDVNVEVTLGMKDDDSAATCGTRSTTLQAVETAHPAGGRRQPRAKPLADVVATIKTSSKNKDVTISGKVTGANIGQMVKTGGDGQ